MQTFTLPVIVFILAHVSILPNAEPISIVRKSSSRIHAARDLDAPPLTESINSTAGSQDNLPNTLHLGTIRCLTARDLPGGVARPAIKGADCLGLLYKMAFQDDFTDDILWNTKIKWPLATHPVRTCRTVMTQKAWFSNDRFPKAHVAHAFAKMIDQCVNTDRFGGQGAAIDISGPNGIDHGFKLLVLHPEVLTTELDRMINQTAAIS